MIAPKALTVKLVRDLMHRNLTSCPVDTPFRDAVRILVAEALESLIVLGSQGRAVGLFGRREVIEVYARLGTKSLDDLQKLTLADTMNTDIPTVPPDIPALTAAQIMLDQGLRDIYVMHPTKDSSTPNRPVGVLWLSDVVAEIASE